ncbi:MAG: hypothetical protein WBH90_08770 [Aggregatilineales bacterium]|nr:hypothetical protein [Chloroflexota bacterium]HOA25634.1 hypothetical protein [Aggregatilineales bacterium]HPV06406.1 hypothetical protein [Aggregatilineales bacterium]HQE18375.1 hypothetical protein [Aggregatilineales bacterium]
MTDNSGAARSTESEPKPGDRNHLSWRGWLVLAMWVVVLIIFLEYAVRSVQEREIQAAVIAGIVFVFLLLGGLVLLTLRRIEADERENWQMMRHRDD